MGYKPGESGNAVSLATHLDSAKAEDDFQTLEELYAEQLNVFALSCTAGEHLDEL